MGPEVSDDVGLHEHAPLAISFPDRVRRRPGRAGIEIARGRSRFRQVRQFLPAALTRRIAATDSRIARPDVAGRAATGDAGGTRRDLRIECGPDRQRETGAVRIVAGLRPEPVKHGRALPSGFAMRGRAIGAAIFFGPLAHDSGGVHGRGSLVGEQCLLTRCLRRGSGGKVVLFLPPKLPRPASSVAVPAITSLIRHGDD